MAKVHKALKADLAKARRKRVLPDWHKAIKFRLTQLYNGQKEYHGQLFNLTNRFNALEQTCKVINGGDGEVFHRLMLLERQMSLLIAEQQGLRSDLELATQQPAQSKREYAADMREIEALIDAYKPPHQAASLGSIYKVACELKVRRLRDQVTAEDRSHDQT
jgi:hypothetical protein